MHDKLQLIAVVMDDRMTENALLTPTQKIRRSEIERRHVPLAEPSAALG